MLNADKFGITSKTVDKIVADLENQPKGVKRLFAEDSATAEMADKLGIPKGLGLQGHQPGRRLFRSVRAPSWQRHPPSLSI